MYSNSGGKSDSGGGDYRPPHVPVAETYPNSYGHSDQRQLMQNELNQQQHQQQQHQQQQWEPPQNKDQFNNFQPQNDPDDPFASLVAASNPSTTSTSTPQPQISMMANPPSHQPSTQFSAQTQLEFSSTPFQEQPQQQQQQQQFQAMGQPSTSTMTTGGAMNSGMDPFASNSENNNPGSSMGATTTSDPFAAIPPVGSAMIPPPSTTSSAFDPLGTASISTPSASFAPTQSLQSTSSSSSSLQKPYGQQPANPAPSIIMPSTNAAGASSIVPDQTQVINGIFLGLDAPIKADEETKEDKELKHAQEAAMYAQELLQKQKEEKEKAKGSLFGGLMPKAQNFLQQNAPSAKSFTPNASSTMPFKGSRTTPSPSGDSGYGGHNNRTIQVDDAQYGVTYDTDDRRPPWFATRANHADGDNESPREGVDESSKKEKTGGAAAAIGGAAALGGVAGLMALGPVVGVAAAGAMAIQAARGGDDGILRTTGRAVASVGGVAKRFEDKHGVGKKAATGLVKGVGWAVSAASSAASKK